MREACWGAFIIRLQAHAPKQTHTAHKYAHYHPPRAQPKIQGPPPNTHKHTLHRDIETHTLRRTYTHQSVSSSCAPMRVFGTDLCAVALVLYASQNQTACTHPNTHQHPHPTHTHSKAHALTHRRTDAGGGTLDPPIVHTIRRRERWRTRSMRQSHIKRVAIQDRHAKRENAKRNQRRWVMSVCTRAAERFS